MAVSSGTDRNYVFVTENQAGCQVTALLTRDTPGGLVSHAEKVVLDLGPGSGTDCRSRLKEALIALVEHL